MREKVFDFNCDEDSKDFETLDFDDTLKGKARFVIQTRCPADVGVIEIKVSKFIDKHDFRMVWEVSNETIPYEFHEGVRKGIKRWANKNKIKGLKIEVVGGGFNPMDSRMFSYEMVTVLALNDCFESVLGDKKKLNSN